MVVPGCIKKHYSYGSFVLFSHSLVGLAPTKYIADEFVSEGSDVFKEWQTVVAKVRISICSIRCNCIDVTGSFRWWS